MKLRDLRVRVSRTTANLALAAIAVLAAAGCFASHRPDTVKPQDWWEDRGPVIPHDTFPGDCSLCHTSENWQEIRKDFHFDHEKETGVALKGAHITAECLRCHNDRGPVQSFAARGCAGCHEDIHKGQLGSACDKCHTEDDWRPVGQVAEHARTRFPLFGAHAAVNCIDCHPGAPVGNFTRADTACISCHAAALAQATSPDHVAQGWVNACDRCHVPTSWKGAGFTHAFFPLSGGHSGVACATCHVGGVFTGLSTACSSCHLAAYQATTSPNHQLAGFGTQCEQCHKISSWKNATFNHSSFPLTGKHASTACDACHVGGVFQGTPTQCVACHQSAYDGTTNPNHAASGFSTQCQTCHTTSGWGGANFNHSFFPLTGKHSTTACDACHVGGVFQGTPTDCYSCHKTDYDNTNDPNHAGAGFPTTCQTCHTTSGWGGANFSHPKFPITSGKHSGFACADCHLNPMNFSSFSCIDCHTHNKAATDGHHDEVKNYSYNSQACYNCHPKGKGGD